MNSQTSRFSTTTIKRGIIIGVAGALLMGVMVAQAVSSTNLGTTTVKLTDESFSDDLSVTVASNGIKIVPATDAVAVGTSSPGTAVTSGLPEVTTAVTAGNYSYEFEVKESGLNTLTGSETYRIEVYGTTGATNSLLATFYMNQASAEAGAVEGVTGTIDLGTSINVDSFDIVVELQ